jgi:hypothetical protein
MKTVYWRATDPEHKFVSKLSWAASMYYPMLNKFYDTFFRGDFEKYGKQVYLDHLTEVRSLVPPDRLLEFRIDEGWEPLCNFLGEEVPDTPFPNGNDMKSFSERCRRRNRRQLMNSALHVSVRVVTIGGAILVAAAGMYYNFRR